MLLVRPDIARHASTALAATGRRLFDTNSDADTDGDILRGPTRF